MEDDLPLMEGDLPLKRTIGSWGGRLAALKPAGRGGGRGEGRGEGCEP